MTGFVGALTVFVLAIFVGFEIITKVPPTLHTPLMSGSNALSGITLIGALILAGQPDAPELAHLLAGVAVAFATGLLPQGRDYFWVTFFVLGMQPVTFKTLTNYALELAEPEWHPRYLSTLTICLAIPFPLSLPVGWLVGVVGHVSVFVSVAVLIALDDLRSFTPPACPPHELSRQYASARMLAILEKVARNR